MSELPGGGEDAGEAGETPEPPADGAGTTPGGRFADHTDAQVDAALAAEDYDSGENHGPGGDQVPGTRAGREERTGQVNPGQGQEVGRTQQAEQESQAGQAGQEEAAAGTGEGTARPDDGTAPREPGRADGADVTESHPSATADEYDGDAAALLVEEDPATDSDQATADGHAPDAAPDADQPGVPSARDTGPDDGHAAPDGAPEVGLPDAAADALWAKFEARMVEQDARHEADLQSLEAKYAAREKELTAEIQTLKDTRQAVPDAPGSSGDQAGKPRPKDRRLSERQRDARAAKPEGDKPGLWSNAKAGLYGTVGSAIATVGVSDIILKSPSGAVEAVVTAIPAIVGVLVPVVREGWRRKRDDSPAKQ